MDSSVFATTESAEGGVQACPCAISVMNEYSMQQLAFRVVLSIALTAGVSALGGCGKQDTAAQSGEDLARMRAMMEEDREKKLKAEREHAERSRQAAEAAAAPIAGVKK
jgi:hypothetical protein